ncbi:MAG: hypothetical protein HFJ30_09010 [Clostridia bacterium]|nr:hypothetical protein [Clostridia bacterium]
MKSQYDKAVWYNSTQTNAATQARGMYSNNYVESDLINSYSWDTAIVFIQEYSENSNYANKQSVNTSMLNTGKAGDKVCNIHDMASNCWEWSTEHGTRTSSSSSYPCVPRGGYYNVINKYFVASARGSSFLTATDSFRPLLYVK